MSEERMQQLDEEILEVANRSGLDRAKQESDAAKDAEAARAEQALKEAVAEKTAYTNERNAAMEKDRRRAWRQYQFKRFAVLAGKLACSIVGAFAFLVLLFVDWWVPVMAYTGIAFFLVVAAITVDRFVRRYR